MKIHWLDKPEDHDYPAALSYLCLHVDEHIADQAEARLKYADMAEFKAKDIFRASGLPMLGPSNSHVQKDLHKINEGEKLSPMLLVRYRGRLLVADGYHRLCAVYHYAEDAFIPCKIITIG